MSSNLHTMKIIIIMMNIIYLTIIRFHAVIPYPRKVVWHLIINTVSLYLKSLIMISSLQTIKED